MTEHLLTQSEVCQRLHICRKTLQTLRTRRKIGYIRFGHRTIRFREEHVQEFLRRREQAVAFAEVKSI